MKVLVIGSGKMAQGVIYDLLQNDQLEKLLLIDQSEKALQEMQERFNSTKLQSYKIFADDINSLRPLFEQVDGVISAVPYDYNLALTKLAIETRSHFVDLGGNNTIVEKQFALDPKAKEQRIGVVPDCGLAPGMVSIVTAHAINELARVDSVKIRVGGLPVHPRRPLNYMLVFSVHGLINEYIEDAVILEDGQIKTVPSLTEAEELEFPKPFGLMEAFYTSGGSSTLPQTYSGKINYLDYKTIRYPGHCHIMKAMIDLGFAGQSELELDGRKFKTRAAFEQMLSKPLQYEDDDVVLIRITVRGQKGGDRKIVQYQAIEYGDKRAGLTAMMRTTAFPAAIILQMLIDRKISDRGVLRQELSIPPESFIQELEKRNINFELSE